MPRAGPGPGKLLVGIDPEFGPNVLRSQVHDEALLRPRKGTQHAPVEVGVRDAQVRERLWITLATRRLRGSANHHCILPYAADRIWASPRSAGHIALRRRAMAEMARRTFEWPLREDGRRHVHTRVDTAELPVRHQTRRAGRPCTLVLTKPTPSSSASMQRAAART